MFRVRSFWAATLAAVAMVLSGCSNAPPSISVNLSPSAPQAIDQGQSVAIGAIVTSDTSSKGLTWSLNGPGSLTTSTGLSTTFISPTGILASALQVKITATSLADPTKSATLAITVNPYLNIFFGLTTPANGTVGTPYSQTIPLIGGTAPFQWSIYSGRGSLPAGLTLDATTGTISGTPTGAGTSYFEATATDAVGAESFNGFLSIQINPGPSAAANPVPFLNQPLVPTAAAPAGPGLTLSVSGTGFVSGATIDFNGAPLTTTFVNSQHLSALLPAANVATAKTASVTVVNPAPGGGSSNVDYFQVGAPETTVSFVNAPNSPLQIVEPFGLATADFNQDGKPDLVIAAGGKGLDVMLGNGDGTFTSAPGSPLSMPSPPYDDLDSPYIGPLAVGDFNHSGHPGLAVGEFENQSAILMLGNGNGTFSFAGSLSDTDGTRLEWLTAADFNADGNLDLVAVNGISGQSPVVLLGYGDGLFNSVTQNVGEQWILAGSSAAGDFNGDGKLDIALTGSGAGFTSAVSILLGNGDGTFTQPAGSPMPLGQDVFGIVAADFNGDGKLDLAVTDFNANTVLILLGNGDGTFQLPMTIPVGNEPSTMVVGDFNNDGNLDLAVANYGGSVTLLLGNGDGTFTEATGSPYAFGNSAYGIVAADFNGDGKLDLAVTNNETVSILLQQ